MHDLVLSNSIEQVLRGHKTLKCLFSNLIAVNFFSTD